MVATHWNKPYGVHLMGIAMHVYADTFAHQGFAGVIHAYNKVDNL
ncbi:putative signal peptide domain protein, partial [Vibrio parahaemolyticus VPCR-2010]